MSKWIEIDTPLIKTISAGHLSAKAIWRLLMRQPSIDLVTCRECKYYGSGACEVMDGMRGFKPDDFCSYGERMQVMYYPQVDGITPSVIGKCSEKPNNSERSSE